MKKIFTLALVLLFTLSGCKNAPNDKTTITFWTLQMSDFSPYINEIINTYEQSHPNIDIVWTDVPFSEGEKRTLAAVLGNNPPDLINLNPDFSALLAQRGALEKIPTEKVSNFNPQIIEYLKYNNELYSIPWYATSSVTFINKDLLNQTNMGKTEASTKKVRKWVSAYKFEMVDKKYDKVVHPIPISYTQLYRNAKEAKELSGAYIYIPNLTENDTMVRILNKYGINSPQTVNSEESVLLFNHFRELYQFGLIPKETISITHRESFEQYMAGKSIFFQAGANFLSMLKENAPNVYASTIIRPQIMGSRGQYDFSLMNFVIPVKSKNKDIALDFCLFLTNAENQLKLAKLTNVIATDKQALKSDFYNNYITKQAQARSISAKQLQKVHPVMKNIKKQKELNTLVNTALQEILTVKENNTQKILDKLSVDWQNLIAE